VTQDDQRQRFFGGEIRGRQEVGGGNPITLLVLVEHQRDAGRAQRIEIAKDRPPAYFARLGQRLNVLPPSRLEQADELKQTADSGKVHGRFPVGRSPVR